MNRKELETTYNKIYADYGRYTTQEAIEFLEGEVLSPEEAQDAIYHFTHRPVFLAPLRRQLGGLGLVSRIPPNHGTILGEEHWELEIMSIEGNRYEIRVSLDTLYRTNGVTPTEGFLARVATFINGDLDKEYRYPDNIDKLVYRILEWKSAFQMLSVN